MAPETRKPLAHYLSLQYRFDVIADPDGGYVITFPDLPGCITQVESVDQIPATSTDVRELWIETEYERGADIPLPSFPEEYSGKFNVRIPRSLHRRLAESAARDGVSLNQHVLALLDRGDALTEIQRQLNALAGQLDRPEPRSHYRRPA